MAVWVGRSSQICAAAIYGSHVIGECLRIERYIATGCSVPLNSLIGPVCVVVSGYSAPVSLAVLVGNGNNSVWWFGCLWNIF